jgi:hypothetical protein
VFTRHLHAENRPVIAVCDHSRVAVGSKMVIAAILAAISLAFAAPALASNGKGPVKSTTTTTVSQSGSVVHVQGVVQSVSASAVVVRQLDGSAVSVAIDRQTRITIGARPGRIGDVKPGFVLVTTVKAGQPASTLRFLRPS